MDRRHQTDNYGPQKHPRDSHGRFEATSERSEHHRGNDRPRDDEGRFESESYQSSGHFREHDQPRDEYGHFVSTREPSYRGEERSEDEYGRFEQAGDRYSGEDQTRDEHGRFTSVYERPGGYARSYGRRESAFGGRYFQDRPRDQYGRFESPGKFHPGSFVGTRQSGGFTGRGPKGYRRSDERIQEEINEALTEDPDLDASEIEVKVENGVVKLSGTVPERQFKRMAEDIAEGCSGVQDVHNEIRLRRDSESNGSQTNQSHREKASAAAQKASTV